MTDSLGFASKLVFSREGMGCEGGWMGWKDGLNERPAPRWSRKIYWKRQS